VIVLRSDTGSPLPLRLEEPAFEAAVAAIAALV
jgi:hypothetical protein